MKSLIKQIALFLPILFIVALIGLYIGLNSIVHRSITTVGSTLIGTEVALEKVRISLLSGQGMIRGFTVANPEGSKSPSAFELGELVVDIDLETLFSDVIVIRSIEILTPSVTVEGLTATNLRELQQNVESDEGSNETEELEEAKPTEPGKKVIIEHLVMSGGSIQYRPGILNGKSVGIALPDIELKDLGKKQGGASLSELVSELLTMLGDSVISTLKGSTSLLTSRGKDMTNGAAKELQLIEAASREGAKAVSDSAKVLGNPSTQIVENLDSLLPHPKK